MNEYGNRFGLVFKCDLEGISDTVSLCIAQIEQNVKSEFMDLGIMTRIKWVITEMLTNAIKHSGVEECVLMIRADEKQLLFEKQEQGHPLSLLEYGSGTRISWPLEEELVPNAFQVYHNGSESLWAEATSPDTAIFYVKELENVQMPDLLDDTSEHFGLLILTKASDGFEYHFNEAVNHFRCTFNLQTS